jgi:Ca-activated chloride channel family protein
MWPELLAVGVILLMALAEWWHARRSARVALLAFGPSGKARWTVAVPFIRTGAVGLLAWGFVHLLLMDPRTLKPVHTPEGGYRHLLIALDVSPSMQLKDAGPAAQQTRAQRAAEVLMSVLNRSALDQMRVSIVAFYTGAKPVVIDTYDLEVVKNILNDLPLDWAFEVGKTTIMEGIEAACDVAKPWKPGSTTLILVSDGDTVADSGMPPLPPAIAKVLVVGVGDARAGKFIDGHQSRQDSSTLRQVATRLRGVYHDGNEKHLPSAELAALSKVLPMQDSRQKGLRELALIAVSLGAAALSGLPVALALAGCSWQPGYRPSRPRTTAPQLAAQIK